MSRSLFGGSALNNASQAISDGRGFQLIADVMEDFRRSGLTEKEAVHEMVMVLDVFQENNEESALVLIKHLREWMDERVSPDLRATLTNVRGTRP